MTTRRTLATALGLTTATLGAGLAAAAPASAGGIAVIASPSFDNSCANSQSTDASGPTRHGAGTASGLRTQHPPTHPSTTAAGRTCPASTTSSKPWHSPPTSTTSTSTAATSAPPTTARPLTAPKAWHERPSSDAGYALTKQPPNRRVRRRDAGRRGPGLGRRPPSRTGACAPDGSPRPAPNCPCRGMVVSASVQGVVAPGVDRWP